MSNQVETHWPKVSIHDWCSHFEVEFDLLDDMIYEAPAGLTLADIAKAVYPLPRQKIEHALQVLVLSGKVKRSGEFKYYSTRENTIDE